MQNRSKENLREYRIFETNEFLKKVEKLSSQNRFFIEKKAKSYIYPQLKAEPHFGLNIKKLTNYNPETWRYRIGKFRLFYLINEDEKVVYLLTIEFRKDAY